MAIRTNCLLFRSYGMRREPEGIEHETTPKSSRPSSALLGGHYDHSHNQEYDPYQSAARQMQELLFGNNKNDGAADNNANLRPSHNSAFQKYVPSANVPSTADINNKACASYLCACKDSFNVLFV